MLQKTERKCKASLLEIFLATKRLVYVAARSSCRTRLRLPLKGPKEEDVLETAVAKAHSELFENTSTGFATLSDGKGNACRIYDKVIFQVKN